MSKEISKNGIHQSSILVAVRVRPFTVEEQAHLADLPERAQCTSFCFSDSNLKIPGTQMMTSTPTRASNDGEAKYKLGGIRRIVDCVDDRMLIFDPIETNRLHKLSETVLNSMLARSRSEVRRRIRRNGEQKFIFDRLFDVDTTQQEIFYGTTRPLLESILDGFNGTIFAYGATGCGKTYTITGTLKDPGIVFLTMQELFQRIEDLKDSKVFELTVSYLEIYNETIRDLLKPDTPSQKLIIREDTDRTTTVANLSYHSPQTVEDVMDLVIRGNKNRTTSATDANETSSRSHAVLQVHVVQVNRSVDLKQEKMYATLSIIDLAGSERASATKNRGERLHEGSNINRSLLALGNCISALCMTERRAFYHVPYRDSKLTRLLKFSLGGNCKTVMIVCVSPSSVHYDETLNTLKYANRAKNIKTKVIRNQHSLDRHVGSYLKMITVQKQEIEDLRNREAKMVDLRLQQYKLSRNKLQMAMRESINQQKSNFQISDRITRSKTMKSLMLCKRHFLQLVKVDIQHLLSLTESVTSHPLIGFCKTINEQLKTKISELEDAFDDDDEFVTSVQHSKEVELNRLKSMESWNNAIDTVWYEQQLDYLIDSIRYEIIVNASIMIDKVLQDTKLRSRYNFATQSLFNLIFVDNYKSESKTVLKSYKTFLDKICDNIIDLVQIDEEFELFANKICAFNEDVNKRKQSNELSRQPVKMRSPGSNIISKPRDSSENITNSPSPITRTERVNPVLNVRRLRIMGETPEISVSTINNRPESSASIAAFVPNLSPSSPTEAVTTSLQLDSNDSMSISNARNNLARVNINEDNISIVETEDVPIKRDINKPKLSLTSTILRSK